MRKKSKNLKRKIANYSLVAAGALTMLTACKKEEDNDPNIVDVDVDPDISLTAPANSEANANIDFNNDGIVDVVAYSYNYAYGSNDLNGGGVASGYNSGAEFLTIEESLTAGGTSYTFDMARGLESGTEVSASQLTWNGYAYLGFNGLAYGDNISIGQFFGVDKYVGVRFTVAGNTHYAWMLIGMTANGSSVTIKEYAYHATPNTPIEAGKK